MSNLFRLPIGALTGQGLSNRVPLLTSNLSILLYVQQKSRDRFLSIHVLLSYMLILGYLGYRIGEAIISANGRRERNRTVTYRRLLWLPIRLPTPVDTFKNIKIPQFEKIRR
jgi:hypothetical protein